MAYKRLTQGKITKDNVILIRNEHNDIIMHQDAYDMFAKAYNRLAELEDKIEQGTLIELPRIVRYVCYYSGLEKYVVQWETNGKIKSKTFWNEKEAKKKLKELQNG